MDHLSLNTALVRQVTLAPHLPTQRLPQELQRSVDDLVAECLRVPVHWETRSPEGARAVVKGTMRRRHAELTEEALEALAAHYVAQLHGAVD